MLHVSTLNVHNQTRKYTKIKKDGILGVSGKSAEQRRLRLLQNACASDMHVVVVVVE
jgi:hypothetical protein